jgi:hypothetical protein
MDLLIGTWFFGSEQAHKERFFTGAHLILNFHIPAVRTLSGLKKIAVSACYCQIKNAGSGEESRNC